MTWDAQGWHDVAPEMINAWKAAYPRIDVDVELAKMHAWLASNPRKARKTLWTRFVTNWLARAKPTERRAVTCQLTQQQQPEVQVFE